jgi:hypothetical protein
MILEMLESVIFLEIFPFGKWHYTERPNVDILLFFRIAQTRHCLEGCFPLEYLRFTVFTRVSFRISPRESPRGVHMRPAWGGS